MIGLANGEISSSSTSISNIRFLLTLFITSFVSINPVFAAGRYTSLFNKEKIDQNKEEIVKRIFNSSGIEIGELKIEFMDLEQFPLNFIFILKNIQNSLY